MSFDIPWTTEFLRQAVLSGSTDTIGKWGAHLLDALRDAKPDHAAWLFGVSRRPKTPNFLLGSSSEHVLNGPIPQVFVNEQTVDIFLGPRPHGVRIIKEEFPLTVSVEVVGSDKRRDVSFYEAICFDSEHSSILMALTVSDGSVDEFLASEEIAELHAMVRSQAVPMLELEQIRFLLARQNEEIQLMMGVVRESTGGLSALSAMTPVPGNNIPSGEGVSADSAFLSYLTNELRNTLNQLMSASEKQVTLARTGASPGQLMELSSTIYNAARAQRRVLRNLSNLANLSHPEVRPRKGAMGLQQLLREVHQVAMSEATAVGARLKLEEHTRNIYVSGDRETLEKMIERLIKFNLSFCTQGTEVYIRTDDDPDRVENGYVLFEIEDMGENQREINPASLLVRTTLLAPTHPRLKHGGGILFQLLDLFMQKSGGKFRLARGPMGGFACQFLLPLVPRSEMERLKAGEIG